MVAKQVTFTFEPMFYRRLLSKSKKAGYKNVQQYGYDLLHHAVYGKKNSGGRPKRKNPEREYLDKFSTPTKETYKIERSAGLR